MSRRVACLVILSLVCWLMPHQALAAVTCSTNAPSTMDFGSVSPLTAAPTDVSPTFTVTCSAIRGDWPAPNNANHQLNVCLSYNNGTGGASAGGNRQMTNGTNQAIYDLYTTSAHAVPHWGDRSGTPAGTVVQSAVFPAQGRPAVGVVVSGSPSFTTFARLTGGQTTLPPSATPYASTLTLKIESYWDTDIPANCGAGGSPTPPVPTTAVQTIQVTLVKECIVGTIGDLVFGTSGFLRSNIDNTTSVSVTCTSTTPYKVGLSAGAGSGATTSVRKMTRTAAPLSTINYGLYRDNPRSLNWGNDTTGGTDTQNGTGTGSVSPPGGYTIYGRVPPQNTPEPGVYQDTVVLTVAF